MDTETFEINGHELTVTRTFESGFARVVEVTVAGKSFPTVDAAIDYVDSLTLNA